MTWLIPEGERSFTAKVSRFDDPKANRVLTTKALSWETARAYFAQHLEPNEYIWDCCDNGACTPTKPPS